MLSLGTQYSIETLSAVEGLKFSRNNGRNSKNIQHFPRVALEEERKLGHHRVPVLRVNVTCPSAEALSTAIVMATMMPEMRAPTSAWYGHKCAPGSTDCRDAPTLIGTLEEANGCVGTFSFKPKKVWSYNHAMKKNLGKKRELHCLQYSVFQGEYCVFNCFGPTFELENRKRSQSSRKRRMPTTPVEKVDAPRSEPSSVTTGTASADSVYLLGRPTTRRRLEVEECMALDNTLATVFLTDDAEVPQFFDDPDLMSLMTHHEEEKSGVRDRDCGSESDDIIMAGSELVKVFDGDEDSTVSQVDAVGTKKESSRPARSKRMLRKRAQEDACNPPSAKSHGRSSKAGTDKTDDAATMLRNLSLDRTPEINLGDVDELFDVLVDDNGPVGLDGISPFGTDAGRVPLNKTADAGIDFVTGQRETHNTRRSARLQVEYPAGRHGPMQVVLPQPKKAQAGCNARSAWTAGVGLMFVMTIAIAASILVASANSEASATSDHAPVATQALASTASCSLGAWTEFGECCNGFRTRVRPVQHGSGCPGEQSPERLESVPCSQPSAMCANRVLLTEQQSSNLRGRQAA